MTYRWFSIIIAAVICWSLNSCAIGVHEGQEPDGPWVDFYENGKKREEGYYLDGHMVGTWSRWYDNGQFLSKGVMAQSDTFGSSRIGIWQYWHWNGRLAATGAYRDDMFDGKWTFWDREGNAISQPILKRGAGDYVETYSSGEQRCAGPLVRNLRNGHWTFWYKSGRKMSEGECKGGNREGELMFWKEDGSIAANRTFNWLTDGDWDAIAASIAE